MVQVCVGDRVLFQQRVFVVEGLSPSSIQPRIVHIVGEATGERLAVSAEDLERAGGDPAAAA